METKEDVYQILQRWIEFKQELDRVKQNELELRNQLCSIFLEKTIPGSTHSFKFGEYKISAKAPVSYKIDKEILHNLSGQLTEEDGKAVKIEYSLDKKMYDKLPGTSKLHEAIVSKVGTPTLSFEVIKE